MFSKSILLAVPWILLSIVARADDMQVHEPGRGELLYETHCLACHNTEVHWRDKENAKTWDGLHAEVTRWQKFSGLSWNDKDIEAVTRYLNMLYYHFHAPDQP